MKSCSPELEGKSPIELSLRAIILAILLAAILAMSNAFLALKLGILTSASIPAAIISMGVLRFFKNPSILENNAVQTAASAGEAVAGGIVYTIPALVIIGYWHGFSYWANFFIAFAGGVLGVLFSIPLRKVLVHDTALKFPEGRAIAEVLKSSEGRLGFGDILWGGLIGSLLELSQVGLKVLANSWSYWFKARNLVFGASIGFSVTMIGAGFLVGYEMALSIFLGAVLSWLLLLPALSPCYPELLANQAPAEAVSLLWNSELRYLGIGAMLFAGIWTMLRLARPLLNNIYLSFRLAHLSSTNSQAIPRTERDLPISYILMGTLGIAALLFLFFQAEFPLAQLALDGQFAPTLVFFAVLYVLVLGFFFSVITAYFSGMVGVTASPGSSVMIAGILFAAWLLLLILKTALVFPLSPEKLKAAEAITIMIGSVVMGIAAIANDNSQDLKVGQLVGATPWKQQLMLLLGVLVSALVIPPVMQLMFDVYGIAGVFPRPGMNPADALPAPTAALLSAVTEAVFRNSLPWKMMVLGALLIVLLLLLNRFVPWIRRAKLSILGLAIGMYLPMTISFPLFLGGLLAYAVNRRLARQQPKAEKQATAKQTGTLIACGIVAGSALMDVLLAIPFSLLKTADALRLLGDDWQQYTVLLSVLAIMLLAFWIDKRVLAKGKHE